MIVEDSKRGKVCWASMMGCGWIDEGLNETGTSRGIV
jgi:hypothetical protein